MGRGGTHTGHWSHRKKEETTRKTICRWVEYTEMDLGEKVLTVLVWLRIGTTGERTLVNKGMNFQVPQNGGKFLSDCLPDALLTRGQLHGANIIVFMRL
jgi:hypothetical protein